MKLYSSRKEKNLKKELFFIYNISNEYSSSLDLSKYMLFDAFQTTYKNIVFWKTGVLELLTKRENNFALRMQLKMI